MRFTTWKTLPGISSTATAETVTRLTINHTVLPLHPVGEVAAHIAGLVAPGRHPAEPSRGVPQVVRAR